MYGWGGRIEQEDFLKKKKTLRGTLGNSAAAAATVSSPTSRPPCVSAGLWGASSPNPKHGVGGVESAHRGGGRPRPQAPTWESAILET